MSATNKVSSNNRLALKTWTRSSVDGLNSAGSVGSSTDARVFVQNGKPIDDLDTYELKNAVQPSIPSPIDPSSESQTNPIYPSQTNSTSKQTTSKQTTFTTVSPTVSPTDLLQDLITSSSSTTSIPSNKLSAATVEAEAQQQQQQQQPKQQLFDKQQKQQDIKTEEKYIQQIAQQQLQIEEQQQQLKKMQHQLYLQKQMHQQQIKKNQQIYDIHQSIIDSELVDTRKQLSDLQDITEQQRHHRISASDALSNLSKRLLDDKKILKQELQTSNQKLIEAEYKIEISLNQLQILSLEKDTHANIENSMKIRATRAEKAVLRAATQMERYVNQITALSDQLENAKKDIKNLDFHSNQNHKNIEIEVERLNAELQGALQLLRVKDLMTSPKRQLQDKRLFDIESSISRNNYNYASRIPTFVPESIRHLVEVEVLKEDEEQAEQDSKINSIESAPVTLVNVSRNNTIEEVLHRKNTGRYSKTDLQHRHRLPKMLDTMLDTGTSLQRKSTGTGGSTRIKTIQNPNKNKGNGTVSTVSTRTRTKKRYTYTKSSNDMF